MKKIVSELDIVTLLLIATTIVSCFKNNSYHVAIISISLLIYKTVSNYINILQIKQINDEKFNELNSKLEDINDRVKHLTSKDTIKEVMSGLSNKR